MIPHVLVSDPIVMRRRFLVADFLTSLTELFNIKDVTNATTKDILLILIIPTGSIEVTFQKYPAVRHARKMTNI